MVYTHTIQQRRPGSGKWPLKYFNYIPVVVLENTPQN